MGASVGAGSELQLQQHAPYRMARWIADRHGVTVVLVENFASTGHCLVLSAVPLGARDTVVPPNGRLDRESVAINHAIGHHFTPPPKPRSLMCPDSLGCRPFRRRPGHRFIRGCHGT